MKKSVSVSLILILAASLILAGCGGNAPSSGTIATIETVDGRKSTEVSDKTKEAGSTDSGSTGKTTEAASDESTDSSQAVPEGIDIPELEDGVNTLKITLAEGTADCWTLDGQTLTFSGLTEDTVVTLEGSFDGSIVVDAGDDYKFELELNGATLFCGTESPVTVLSGKKFTLSAKKDTENYIYDTREQVSSADEDVHSAAVYSTSDTDLEGKGTLTLISRYNNGIHTKDDLHVKNLNLLVTCQDNALKGNDSVTIESGFVCLIATTGDTVKTTNTDVSEKGNQRGAVTISGGTVKLYAACDGIDAAYDADISGDCDLEIHTDSYSPYSSDVDNTGDEGAGDVRYIRFNLNTYSFSVKYYNSESDYKWVNASYYKSVSGGRSTYYYYTVEKLTDYEQVKFFIYADGQKQGQEEEYAACSDYMTWNTAYDTFALEASQRGTTYNWTNYTTNVDSWGGRGGMGPGGMNDGNTDKGEYSTKGIKAGNEVRVSGGTVLIESYDDAIHANSETTLENGESPTGNVTISGGELTVSSKDDGVHADGCLTVSGGSLNVTGSYEGLEGYTILVSGGDINIVSSDDGMNATTTSGAGITFEGGSVFIYAGGDGIDSNSRTQYRGIVFSGGSVRVVSTTSMNSSLDTEQGYTYEGGSVLAICPANAMTSEVTSCKNFSSIGTRTSMSLSSGQEVTVTVKKEETISLTMPCSMSSFVVYLGSSGASISAN